MSRHPTSSRGDATLPHRLSPRIDVRSLATSTIGSIRVTGGTLANEVDGSSDLARWVPLAELDSLPLVDLVTVGARLAGVPLQ